MKHVAVTLALVFALQFTAAGAQERIGAIGPSFGHAIALGSQTLAVGAPEHDQGRGGFWIYRRLDAGGWTLELQVDGSLGDSLGYSLDLDGSQLLIGAPGGGRACIYLRESAGWREQACLQASGVRFGAAVALRNIFAVVGSPEYDQRRGRVDIYTNVGQDVWTHHSMLPGEQQEDTFGSALAVNLEMLLVGAPRADEPRGRDAGLTYAYHRTGGSDWVLQAVLTAGDAGFDQGFGNAVTIEEAQQTTHALIGAARAKRTYLFVHNQDLWEQADFFTPVPGMPSQAPGTSVALSDDIAIIGSPSTTPAKPGAAWIMQIDTTRIWQLTHHLENHPAFGTSVSAHTGQFAVASPGEGIYVYSRSHVLARAPAPEVPMFGGYPNPFTDLLTITLDGTAHSVMQVTIYDAAGRQIAVLDARGRSSLNWSPAYLTPGFYTAIARSSTGMDMRHFVRIAQ